MKLLFVFFIIFFSLNVHAYRDFYHAVGYDENGTRLQGTLYTNDDPLEVKGNVSDSDGNIYEYWGRWNGEGKVTGQIDDGRNIDLKTY